MLLTSAKMAGRTKFGFLSKCDSVQLGLHNTKNPKQRGVQNSSLMLFSLADTLDTQSQEPSLLPLLLHGSQRWLGDSGGLV